MNLNKRNFIKASNYQIDVQTNVLKKAKFSKMDALTLLETFDIELE